MNDDSARIVIAVTELTPIQELWREALQRLHESPANVHALFIADDQWHRAASLPFTREVSRIGGINANFTQRRASQLHEDAISRTRRRMQNLASEANQTIVFEVLLESNQHRIRELTTGPQSVLIAPSFITRLPLFADLQNLDCSVVLIEAKEETVDSQRATYLS